MAETEICGADGGRGLGSGHVCKCVCRKGHEPVYGRGHGCSCGAVWADKEISPGRESSEVRNARYAVATASPEILAAAKTLAGPENWEELNILRQCQHLWTARDMVSAAYNVTFSTDNIARTVSATGLSIQSVAEVARELKNA